MNAIASMCPEPLPQWPVVANATGEPADFSHLPSSVSVTFLVTTSKPSPAASDLLSVLAAFAESLVGLELAELADLTAADGAPESFPLGQAANNRGRKAENSSASSVA